MSLKVDADVEESITGTSTHLFSSLGKLALVLIVAIAARW